MPGVAELAGMEAGLEALFWCGLVLVLFAGVHEASRLLPHRSARRLFLPPDAFWSGGWGRGLCGLALTPVVMVSELMCLQPAWRTAGLAVQGAALGLLALCLFALLRRLPAGYGWCRPAPALVLSVMLARCCWLAGALYLTEVM